MRAFAIRTTRPPRPVRGLLVAVLALVVITTGCIQSNNKVRATSPMTPASPTLVDHREPVAASFVVGRTRLSSVFASCWRATCCPTPTRAPCRTPLPSRSRSCWPQPRATRQPRSTSRATPIPTAPRPTNHDLGPAGGGRPGLVREPQRPEQRHQRDGLGRGQAGYDERHAREQGQEPAGGDHTQGQLLKVAGPACPQRRRSLWSSRWPS